MRNPLYFWRSSTRSNIRSGGRAVAILMALAFGLARTEQASADLVLTFFPSATTIDIGETATIEVLLVQTDPILTSIDLRSNGVLLADIPLHSSSNSALVNNVVFGTGFENGSTNLSSPLEPMLSFASVDFFNGVTAPSGTTTSVSLGTFDVLGNQAGQSDFTINPDPILQEFVFSGMENIDIDDSIFGNQSFSVSVVAVPEPSSAALVALNVGLLMLRRRRRW